MRVFTLLIAAVLLSACAGANTFDSTMNARYVGQPVAAAYRDFGTPTGRYDTPQGPVFVWQKRDAESIFGPRVSHGRGYNILGNVYWQGVTYHRCVIRAASDGAVVRKLTFEGDPGGCEIVTGYRAPRLGRSAHQAR